MPQELIHSCPELIEYIRQVGMLPLLSMGIAGWSAEEVTDEDCQYTQLPDGGWEWPLWEWKGAILQESGCAYGKFFKGKAAFISREWWPDFSNYRRSLFPYPEEGSIEETILDVLKIEGHQITRKLRTSCGFTGPKMRSRFDAYITRLQMAGYIVTEDFVYPRDRHGRLHARPAVSGKTSEPRAVRPWLCHFVLWEAQLQTAGRAAQLVSNESMSASTLRIARLRSAALRRVCSLCQRFVPFLGGSFCFGGFFVRAARGASG